jgi:hypothetical protein
MMEDTLDGSRIFKLLEDKNSEEGLLWVIQKGETLIAFFMKMSKDRDHPGAIGKITSAPSNMHLYIYILFLSLS